DPARSVLVLLLSSVLFLVNLSLGALSIGSDEVPRSFAKPDSPAPSEPQGAPHVKGLPDSPTTEPQSASASQPEHEAETLRKSKSRTADCVENSNPTEPGDV